MEGGEGSNCIAEGELGKFEQRRLERLGSEV